MSTCRHCGEPPRGRALTVVMGYVYCDKGECLDAASDATLAAADAGAPIPHYDATAEEIIAALEAGGHRRV